MRTQLLQTVQGVYLTHSSADAPNAWADVATQARFAGSAANAVLSASRAALRLKLGFGCCGSKTDCKADQAEGIADVISVVAFQGVGGPKQCTSKYNECVADRKILACKKFMPVAPTSRRPRQRGRPAALQLSR